MKDKDGNQLEVGKLYYYANEGELKEKAITETFLKNIAFYGVTYHWIYSDYSEGKTCYTLSRNSAIDDAIGYWRGKKKDLTNKLDDVSSTINKLKEELK